jgi:hypothetical protein
LLDGLKKFSCLWASWFDGSELFTASQESRAILIGHVFIDKVGEYLPVFETDVSIVLVLGIKVTII